MQLGTTCNTIGGMTTTKEIPGFPGYRVGSDGSVWSCRIRTYRRGQGRVGVQYVFGTAWFTMKPSIVGNGYLQVQLFKDGKSIHKLVHRLVLESFVGPCPPGMECRHYPDNDRANCSLDNLSWATKKVNQRDRVEHGTDCRGDKQGQSKLTDAQAAQIIPRVDSGESRARIAREFGVSRTIISRLANKKTFRHLRG